MKQTSFFFSAALVEKKVILTFVFFLHDIFCFSILKNKTNIMDACVMRHRSTNAIIQSKYFYIIEFETYHIIRIKKKNYLSIRSHYKKTKIIYVFQTLFFFEIYISKKKNKFLLKNYVYT